MTNPATTTLTTQVATNGFTLSGVDFTSIGKGLLVATAGAALTFLTQAITGSNFVVHYGYLDVKSFDLTPFVYIAWSGIANTVRKILDGIVPQTQIVTPKVS